MPAPSRTLDPEAAADHLSRLSRLAWSLCGSRHLAEELTQETYARPAGCRRLCATWSPPSTWPG